MASMSETPFGFPFLLIPQNVQIPYESGLQVHISTASREHYKHGNETPSSEQRNFSHALLRTTNVMKETARWLICMGDMGCDTTPPPSPLILPIRTTRPEEYSEVNILQRLWANVGACPFMPDSNGMLPAWYGHDPNDIELNMRPTRTGISSTSPVTRGSGNASLESEVSHQEVVIERVGMAFENVPETTMRVFLQATKMSSVDNVNGLSSNVSGGEVILTEPQTSRTLTIQNEVERRRSSVRRRRRCDSAPAASRCPVIKLIHQTGTLLSPESESPTNTDLRTIPSFYPEDLKVHKRSGSAPPVSAYSVIKRLHRSNTVTTFRGLAARSTRLITSDPLIRSRMRKRADSSPGCIFIGPPTPPDIYSSWIKKSFPFSLFLSTKTHLPPLEETGQPLELRRIFRGDIIQLNTRLYHFISHTYRPVTNDHQLKLIGLHDGQEATARASTLLTEFRVCTKIRHHEMRVLKLDSLRTLSTGIRYRALVQFPNGVNEHAYFFSDGGESDFQFFRARKLAFKRKTRFCRSRPVMLLYVMALDQRPGVFYVMGWRFHGGCILTKVKNVTWMPRHHDGRERELLCGTYCVRGHIRGMDKVLSMEEDLLIETGLVDVVSGVCAACRHKL